MMVTAGILSPVLSERANARVLATTVPFALVSPAVSSNPTVSGTGQYVVFTSAPGTDDGRTSSVWLSDASTDQLTELSLPNPLVQVGNSVNPVISADGCVVVMTTEISYDVFRDKDEGSRWDVYRTILPACGGKANDWTLVSTFINDTGDAEARDDVDPDEPAALSGSGSVVAYVRPFVSLSGIPDDGPQPNAVDVVDLTIPVDSPGHTTAAPGLPTEASSNDIAYAGQGSPALSADGNVVVFSSDATSEKAVADWAAPAAGATTVPTEIFAWDRSDGDPFTAVQLVSAGANGAADASAVTPAVSADGRLVAFSSSASNLVQSAELANCQRACPAQLYIVDRDTDNNRVFGEDGKTSIDIISAVTKADGSGISIGNGASFAPSISADGTTLVFATQASNLLEVQTPGGGDVSDGDLIIADVPTDALRRAFESPAPAPGANSHPHLSANSRVLVADSLVADKLLGDPSITGRHVVAASYAPALSLADLDLGTVLVGVPGGEWFVNVVNNGPGSFVPASVTTDNPDFAISGGTCLDLAPVAAGQSCGVTVILTPHAEGPLSATLTVAEAGFGAITLPATLRGAGGEPALAAKPTTAPLGTVVVGQTSATVATFDIFNLSLVPTTLAGVTIDGANPDDFAIVASGCVGDIPLGAECQVLVSFTPTTAGRRTATVSVTTTLGQYTSVLVSGDGVYMPQLIAPPSATPGRDLAIGGTGFPANTGLVVGWSDGKDSILLSTDDKGNFLTFFPVSLSSRPGAATLVAQVPAGPSASTPVTIERTRERAPRRPGTRH
jgi:Tol biopolymer transport system component